MTAPTSVYEAWVSALRLWGADPRHDMAGLPVLVVDSLPPAAYERLLGHLMAAQQRVMDQWSVTFTRDLAAVRDEHSRARVLLGGRVLLARRLQLARHPGLPEVVRTELANGIARDIRQLQQELEEAVMRQQPGTRLDRTQIERALYALRTNPLTAVLDPGFSLQALLDGRVEDPPVPVSPLPPTRGPEAADPDPPVRRRRAIIIDN
ncbi:hypothetical protein L2K20_20435 [Mycobacterium sp. MBM]|nr:hypothetical protein [Mycobacterium sp. MBM]